VATSYFLHAADLHLGSQLKSLGQHLDEERTALIRQLVSAVFNDLIDVAIERNVEFVVLAGDVYDTAENDPSAKLRVIRGFRRLEEAGIRVFMVHGNHDPLGTKMKQVDDLPSNVHVFGYGEVGSETFALRNGVSVTVAGISYKTEKESENLAQKFASVTGSTVVGVLHTNVGNIGTAGGHGNYAPCSQDDLKNSPVNYWALGHIHDRQVVQTPKGYWAYPGNLQGRSTKATECGPKGVLIVGINDMGAITEPEFVAVDRVRFHRLTVNVNDCLSAIQVFDKVAAQIEEVVNGSDSRPMLIRLEISGPTEACEDLQSHKDSLLSDVRNHVASVIGAGDVLKVINSTVPNVDAQELRKRNTVLAAALLALDKSDAPEHVRAEAERLLIEKLAVQV
jgi:DNA repair exonuclease SbcCD nuclease subunit